MNKKHPEIYKNKIESLKTNIQKEYYYKGENSVLKKTKEVKKIDRVDLLNKINNIFNSPNFVYQADINIVFNNGKIINKKIIGKKENYLMTNEGEKIYINDISDIK